MTSIADRLLEGLPALRQCPFCAGSPTVHGDEIQAPFSDQPDDRLLFFGVRCGCDARSALEASPGAAIRLWNRRSLTASFEPARGRPRASADGPVLSEAPVLRRCPFCGSARLLISPGPDGRGAFHPGAAGQHHAVHCHLCGCYGPRFPAADLEEGTVIPATLETPITLQGASWNWNRRKAPFRRRRYRPESHQDWDLQIRRESAAPPTVNLLSEVDRLFDESSLAGASQPTLVVIMGPVATGKTRYRREHYRSGYVVLDAGDIFVRLSRGSYVEFPSLLEHPMDVIGSAVARRAVRERRHIVTEIIGAEAESAKDLIDAMLAGGYRTDVVYVHNDPAQSWEWNVNRSRDNISAYYAERYHRRWLVGAAAEAGAEADAGVRRGA